MTTTHIVLVVFFGVSLFAIFFLAIFYMTFCCKHCRFPTLLKWRGYQLFCPKCGKEEIGGNPYID